MVGKGRGGHGMRREVILVGGGYGMEEEDL